MWEDILRAGSSDNISVHFIGSIVYVEQGLNQVMCQSPLLVIDGQQRLTTVSLLIEALVKEIHAFARYFCNLTLGTEKDAMLNHAFHDLRELKVDVAYPFLLELYHDYATKVLSAADFATAVRLVESYVFRRAICAIPTNSMNKIFATFNKAPKKGPLHREHPSSLLAYAKFSKPSAKRCSRSIPA